MRHQIAKDAPRRPRVRPDVATLPATRKEAYALGVAFYYPGPCKKAAHVSPRRRDSAVCCECANLAAAESHRKRRESGVADADCRPRRDNCRWSRSPGFFLHLGSGWTPMLLPTLVVELAE